MVPTVYALKSRVGKVGVGFGAAFAAAVIITVAMTCAYAAMLLLVHGDGTGLLAGFELIAISAGYVSAKIAFAAIILLALPHVIVSNILHRTSARYYLVSGIVLGCVAIGVVGILQRPRIAPPFSMGPDQYFCLAAAVAAGAVSALTFWKVARPDRESDSGS